MTALSHPVLSVVVGIVSDTTESRATVTHLFACLEALSHQAGAPPFEIIVPYHEQVDGIDMVARRFPAVTLVPVISPDLSRRKAGSREHHDVLRARGLAAARGEVVGLLEDQGRPDPHWCANVIAAHRGDVSAVGGAIENGVDRPLNWAIYYCDFGRYQNPLAPGASSTASDANVSYKRRDLESIRSLWEQSFREPVVNGALLLQGRQIELQPNVIVYQNRQNLRLGSALRERFSWGRSYARTRSRLLTKTRRAAYAALSPLLPPLLLLRMAVTAWRRGTHFRQFATALPLITLLVIAWTLGECTGYVTGPTRQ
jgi:hypothetical protein